MDRLTLAVNMLSYCCMKDGRYDLDRYPNAVPYEMNVLRNDGDEGLNQDERETQIL